LRPVVQSILQMSDGVANRPIDAHSRLSSAGNSVSP
jgi:hypothetical protein